MAGFQKRLLALAVAAGVTICGAVASLAQEQAPEPAGEPSPAQPLGAAGENAIRLDELYAQLAEPEREDWSRVESEIVRLWQQSGSPAMDLLLRRATDAMEAEDFDAAIEHLGALTDHAPGFAEGWNARATAFYLIDEYALSMADIEHTLALNPRHFGALEGLAAIFEQSDRPDLALRAVRAAHEINPNRPSLQESLERLERLAGAVEL